jgi:hypothetical protein
VRLRHGSGRREVGGGLDVPIIVALSAVHQTERWAQAGGFRKSPTIGAVTIAGPAERTILTVEGEADVLQLRVSMRLIEEVADAQVQSVRSLLNEHDFVIERSAMDALAALKDCNSHSDLLLHSIGYRLADIFGQPGAGAPNGAPRRGGITSPALQRIHDLVQARLDEPMPVSPTLSELAQAGGVSTLKGVVRLTAEAAPKACG